jgi:predicted NAD/FAD-binding protein
MGVWIQNIAQQLQNQNPRLQIKTSAKVLNISVMEDNSYMITYSTKNGEKLSLVADRVVVATHPVFSHQFFQDEAFAEMKSLLRSLPYTMNHLAIHRDQSVMCPYANSFFNVRMHDSKNFYISQNLDLVNPQFGALVKSWIPTESEFERLKKSDQILTHISYFHPVETVDFVQKVRQLKALAKKRGTLVFAGGWSNLFETQDSAVESGYKAAIALDPSVVDYWEESLPTLTKRPLRP